MSTLLHTPAAERSDPATMVADYAKARREVSRLTVEIAVVLGEVDRLLADRTTSDADMRPLMARLHPLRVERGSWMAVTEALATMLSGGAPAAA